MPLSSVEVRFRLISSTQARAFCRRRRTWWLGGCDKGRSARSQGAPRLSLPFGLGLIHGFFFPRPHTDRMYREAWDSWRDVLERLLSFLQSHAQQFARLPQTLYDIKKCGIDGRRRPYLCWYV